MSEPIPSSSAMVIAGAEHPLLAERVLGSGMASDLTTLQRTATVRQTRYKVRQDRCRPFAFSRYGGPEALALEDVETPARR